MLFMLTIHKETIPKLCSRLLQNEGFDPFGPLKQSYLLFRGFLGWCCVNEGGAIIAIYYLGQPVQVLFTNTGGVLDIIHCRFSREDGDGNRLEHEVGVSCKIKFSWMPHVIRSESIRLHHAVQEYVHAEECNLFILTHLYFAVSRKANKCFNTRSKTAPLPLITREPLKRTASITIVLNTAKLKTGERAQSFCGPTTRLPPPLTLPNTRGYSNTRRTR